VLDVSSRNYLVLVLVEPEIRSIHVDSPGPRRTPLPRFPDSPSTGVRKPADSSTRSATSLPDKAHRRHSFARTVLPGVPQFPLVEIVSGRPDCIVQNTPEQLVIQVQIVVDRSLLLSTKSSAEFATTLPRCSMLLVSMRTACDGSCRMGSK
jgi:hypothetical protein